ncbi:hypothetical protein CsatB_016503 [Cannabis sativa]
MRKQQHNYYLLFFLTILLLFIDLNIMVQIAESRPLRPSSKTHVGNIRRRRRQNDRVLVSSSSSSHRDRVYYNKLASGPSGKGTGH